LPGYTPVLLLLLLAPPHPAPLLRLPIAILLEGYLDVCVCSSLPTTNKQPIRLSEEKVNTKKRH
ncbi:hypothetical protein COCC4DRAFT_30441, partial [Bipolaris maydis ATCC 48331]